MAAKEEGSGAQTALMGLGVLMSLGSGWVEGQMIEAQNITNRANAAAENLMRDANNQLTAAQGSLARFNQSVNNQRIAQQTGAQAEAALVNYRRGRDSASTDDFETQIQFAEQRGAQAAAAATSGLVGGVADMVSSTSALRESRIKQRTVERIGQADYDAAKQQGQIMRAGLEQMSTDSVVDNLDESISVFSEQVRSGNVFGDVLKGLASNPKNTANVFSFNSKPDVTDEGYSIGQGSAYGGNRKGL